MKRTLAIMMLISIMLLSLSIVSLYSQEYDFRNIRWGMDRADIEKLEANAEKAGSTDTGVSYKTTYYSFPAVYGYIFTEEKVTSGAIFIQPENFAKELDKIRVTYDQIKADFVKKYGPAVNDEPIWKSEADKKRYGKGGTEENLSFALNMGLVMYRAEWKLKRTTISMNLLVADITKFFFVIKYDEVVQSGGAPDFENVNWGMDRETIECNETRTKIASVDSGFSVQGTQWFGMNRLVAYRFENGKLNSGAYILKHDDWVKKLDQIIKNYFDISIELSKKYGPPSSHDELWKSEEDKKRYGKGGTEENLSFAVNFGLLTYKTEWKLPKTKIIMFLFVKDITDFNFMVIFEKL